MNKILQILLEQGANSGFAAVEGFAQKTEKHEYEFCPTESPSMHTIDTQRAIVRAFWETGDPVGFSLSKPDIHVVKSSFSRIYTSHLPDDKKNFSHLLPGEVRQKNMNIYDNSFHSVNLQTFNEILEHIHEIMVSFPFQGLKITRVHLAKTLKKVYIGNSNGLYSKYRKTNFNLILGFTMRGNTMDISENRVFFQQFEPYKIISRGFNLLNSLVESGFSASKNLSLILSPEASAFLLREFSSHFKLNSPSGKDDKNIQYPGILNVVDDPNLDGQVGSVPFDDEGIQSGEKYLIQKGNIKGRISDLSTAFVNQTTSTGNGFRNSRFILPTVGFSNLYIKPTVLPLKNLMADAGEGVLVSLVKLKSFDTNGNLFSAYGYRFKEDEILEPVHFYFRTSFRSYFLKILKVSKEIRFFYSSANIGSPYILVEARQKANNFFDI